MNGELLAPYNQLVEFGIVRRAIPATINEAQRLGLIEVKPGSRGASGELAVTKYRLTYRAERCVGVDGATYFSKPTNEWKSVTLEDAKEVRQRAKNQKRESRLSKDERLDSSKRKKPFATGEP